MSRVIEFVSLDGSCRIRWVTQKRSGPGPVPRLGPTDLVHAARKAAGPRTLSLAGDRRTDRCRLLAAARRTDRCRLLAPARRTDRCRLLAPARRSDRCRLLAPARRTDRCRLLAPARRTRRGFQIRPRHPNVSSRPPLPLLYGSRNASNDAIPGLPRVRLRCGPSALPEGNLRSRSRPAIEAEPSGSARTDSRCPAQWPLFKDLTKPLRVDLTRPRVFLTGRLSTFTSRSQPRDNTWAKLNAATMGRNYSGRPFGPSAPEAADSRGRSLSLSASSTVRRRSPRAGSPPSRRRMARRR